MSFYTYIHRRVDTDEVFYIGKGCAKRAWSAKNRSDWWRRVVSKAGGRTVKILAQWPTEAEAFEHEKFLIACFRDLGAPLCNMVSGGRGTSGWSHTAEAKTRIARALKGRPCSPETREKIRAAQIGVPRGPLDPNARAKLSAANKGRKLEPRSAAHSAAISAAKRGVLRGPYDAAHCAAISAGKKAANLARKQREAP